MQRTFLGVFTLKSRISSTLRFSLVDKFIQGRDLLNRNTNTYIRDSISSLGVWSLRWWAATLAYLGVPA